MLGKHNERTCIRILFLRIGDRADLSACCVAVGPMEAAPGYRGADKNVESFLRLIAPKMREGAKPDDPRLKEFQVRPPFSSGHCCCCT